MLIKVVIAGGKNLFFKKYLTNSSIKFKNITSEEAITMLFINILVTKCNIKIIDTHRVLSVVSYYNLWGSYNHWEVLL